MSTIAAERPPQVAPRGPGRVLQPPVGVAIRLVLAWHVVAALVFAWIAWNIVGAVWQLESLPRTAIGAGAAVGIAANVIAAVLYRPIQPSRSDDVVHRQLPDADPGHRPALPVPGPRGVPRRLRRLVQRGLPAFHRHGPGRRLDRPGPPAGRPPHGREPRRRAPSPHRVDRRHAMDRPWRTRRLRPAVAVAAGAVDPRLAAGRGLQPVSPAEHPVRRCDRHPALVHRHDVGPADCHPLRHPRGQAGEPGRLALPVAEPHRLPALLRRPADLLPRHLVLRVGRHHEPHLRGTGQLHRDPRPLGGEHG